MVPVQDKGGNGAALDDLGKPVLALFNPDEIPAVFRFDPFFIGGVPQGFDCPHHGAVRRFDGGGGKDEPPAVFA